jgi:hypothetical protein
MNSPSGRAFWLLSSSFQSNPLISGENLPFLPFLQWNVPIKSKSFPPSRPFNITKKNLPFHPNIFGRQKEGRTQEGAGEFIDIPRKLGKNAVEKRNFGGTAEGGDGVNKKGGR